MKKKVLIAIAIVVIVAGGIIAAVTVSNTIISQSEDYIIMDFDPSAARAHVQELISNGPRMSGSAAELQGAEYTISQWEAAGLQNCHIEKYSVGMFEINRAEFSMVIYGPLMNVPNPLVSNQVFEHIEDFVLQGYSGSRSWSNFMDDLEFVVVGNGSDPGAYDAARGKAALVEAIQESPGNPTMYNYANDAGCAALILQNLWRGD